MDCREFRKKHVAFVDDLLSAVEMDAMDRHMGTCSACARQNTAVRRSLLLFHNLRPIEPSADFMLRLNERIGELGHVSRNDYIMPVARFASVGSFAALAAGVAIVTYMAVETTRYFGEPVAQAAIASAPVRSVPLPPGPSMNAAFVASVPTGIPVWPAMLMVGEAPMRFASLDFRESDGSR
ncbi:MAG: zf-HC2 domain-containing protein [Gemmatimonadaceae bacterium]